MSCPLLSGVCALLMCLHIFSYKHSLPSTVLKQLDLLSRGSSLLPPSVPPPLSTSLYSSLLSTLPPFLSHFLPPFLPFFFLFFLSLFKGLSTLTSQSWLRVSDYILDFLSPQFPTLSSCDSHTPQLRAQVWTPSAIYPTISGHLLLSWPFPDILSQMIHITSQRRKTSEWPSMPAWTSGSFKTVRSLPLYNSIIMK